MVETNNRRLPVGIQSFEEIIENGALLTRKAHDDLNELESEKRILYKKLNELFTMLNKTQAPPTKEYWSELYGVLEEAKIYIDLSSYFIPDESIEPIPYENPEREEVKYAPDDTEENRNKAIEREWNPLCVLEMTMTAAV